MAAASATTPFPLTAKTLIYERISKNLKVDPSHAIPIPESTRNDNFVHVKKSALCARELAWPSEFPHAILAENPTKEITTGYNVAGTLVTAPPGSPFHPGDDLCARTLPSRPGNCRDFPIIRANEIALKPQSLN